MSIHVKCVHCMKYCWYSPSLNLWSTLIHWMQKTESTTQKQYIKHGKCQKNIVLLLPWRWKVPVLSSGVLSSSMDFSIHRCKEMVMLTPSLLQAARGRSYDGCPIEKLECVNHVIKCMGTALRNLVQSKMAGQSISVKGKLTYHCIKKLTKNYGKAIKGNAKDLTSMQNAVWASFLHSLSIKESHNQSLCPQGSNSGCFFQHAENDSVPSLGHPHPLLPEVTEATMPIYQRFGDPQLLSRRLEGQPQNSNESLHSLLWDLCPIECWSNLRTVDALSIAVRHFNKGSAALLDVLFELELMVKPSLQQNALKEDTARVVSATRKSSVKERERRKRI